MKYLLLFSFAIIFVLPTFSQENQGQETTTYFFIRHAEKDRIDTNNKNPNLTQEGILRAAKWSLIFDNVTFDEVFTTDYNRTKQTAQPTAEKKGLDISFYDPRNLFSKDFINTTKGKTVLVVGHSDTTPQFVNAILGFEKFNVIDDNNYANLYIVTISNNREVSDLLLVVD